jgi:hypothetical protein
MTLLEELQNQIDLLERQTEIAYMVYKATNSLKIRDAIRSLKARNNYNKTKSELKQAEDTLKNLLDQ